MAKNPFFKRLYDFLIEEHFEENRQMIFLMGPRQVGKTTASLIIGEEASNFFYLNWDQPKDRMLIIKGADAVGESIQADVFKNEPLVVAFDEIHKFSDWKNFLKGFFDGYGHNCHIIVTGSSRLDVFKRGGDSLMGRYFTYRIHPLSVAEIINPKINPEELQKKPHPISDEDFEVLLQYGGYPEPFLKRNSRFYNKWKALRYQQLFQEDLRDLSRIQEISSLEVLAEMIRQQAGQLCSFLSFSKKVQVSVETIKRWTQVLNSFYYCFSIKPWSKNVSRSLLKEPKYYLWDWSLIDDLGARLENLVASHLLKAVHSWNDRGLGDYGLYFLRDKEKREVDFLVAKNGKPWILIEVKNSGKNSLSSSLIHYQNQLQAPFALQLSAKMPYVNRSCFLGKEPIIVPLKTFLSQLV